MGTPLDDETRVGLIRRGNELFNAGRIDQAGRLFLQAGYVDGIIRVADHLYYTLKKPAAALLLYRQAGCTRKVEEIIECMAGVIRSLLAADAEAEPDGTKGELDDESKQ